MADIPNIMLVPLDDTGIEQFQRFGLGSNYPATPTLNAWYDGGVRFPKFYVQQLCSPTRASALTGLHVVNHGVTELVRGPLQSTSSIARPGLTRPILPRIIRKQRGDVKTAHFGKHHEATEFNGGNLAMNLQGWGHASGHLFNLQAPQSYYNFEKVTNGVVTNENEYLLKVFVREAAEWINQRGKQPWVMNFAPYNCHVQMLTTGVPPVGTFNPAWNTLTENGVFKACIESLDWHLDTLVDAIDPAIWANTIVLAFPDNGSRGSDCSLETDPRTGTTYPLAVADPYSRHKVTGTANPGSRAKDSPFDTGVHSFLIAYNSAGLLAAPGRTVAHPTSVVDLVPTILELIGTTTREKFDGLSLAGYLNNTVSTPIHSFVYSDEALPFGAVKDADRTVESNWMAYDGQYVLLYTQPTGYTGSSHFYDLNADPHQLNNLTPAGSTKNLIPKAKDAHARLSAGRAELVRGL